MAKNAIIAVLVVLLILESIYLFSKNANLAISPAVQSQATSRPRPLSSAGPNARGGAQMILARGSNLKTSPLAPYAFQIAPGALTDSAKAATVGWTITSKQSGDQTIVSLTPKDSDDQSQQYTLKQGQMLYFIEQTKSDDQGDQDKDLNYRDDYGLITDANGIIQ